MKSPTYTIVPCEMGRLNTLIPCTANNPNRIGWTILMQEEDSRLLHEMGDLFSTEQEAHDAAWRKGSIRIRTCSGTGDVNWREEHFVDSNAIMEQLQHIGQGGGFGTTLSYECWWAEAGKEYVRQWRLEID